MQANATQTEKNCECNFDTGIQLPCFHIPFLS